MKPNEPKPQEVYRIFNRETDALCSSYSRAYCDEVDFSSLESARSSNCHGMYANRATHRIAKYKVTYELIDPDVDALTAEELAEYEADKKLKDEIEKEAQDMKLGWLQECIWNVFEFERRKQLICKTDPATPPKPE